LTLRGADGSVGGVEPNEMNLHSLPGAPKGAAVTLTPGKSLSFSIEKRVYLPPGSYEGHLMYTSTVDYTISPQFVRGTISMPLGPMTIEAERQ
jgi:hypothetical protein